MPTTIHTASRPALRAALPAVALLTIVWGSTWPLFPYAVREVSVLTFRAVSVFAAGAVLLAFAAWRGQSLRMPRRAWGPVTAASLVYLFVWNLAGTYAALLIPSGQAAVLGYTMPLWAAVAAWLFLGQRLGRRMLAALALGALGIGILVWRGADTYANAPLGFALGLLAGLAWALGTLILKQWPVPVPATVLTGWQLLIAAAPIALAAIWSGDGDWFVPSWPSIAVIAYITLVPMAIGNVAWFRIVGLLPVNVAGLTSVMVPVVAMISGAIVHAEPLGAAQLVAIACSAGSLMLALLRPSAPFRQ
jgi:drug/metabolite transporter (DMT)-like permease